MLLKAWHLSLETVPQSRTSSRGSSSGTMSTFAVTLPFPSHSETITIPYSRQNRGARAILLSGPPGVGKTTTAKLLSHQLGLETLEFNASDRRNQAAVRQLLHDSVNTASLQFTPGKGKVIIMDEVDGMSAGDRGGMQELVLILFNFYIDSSHSDNACTHHLHLQRSG